MFTDGKHAFEVAVSSEVSLYKLQVIDKDIVIGGGLAFTPRKTAARADCSCYRRLPRAVVSVKEVDKSWLNRLSFESGGVECDFFNCRCHFIIHRLKFTVRSISHTVGDKETNERSLTRDGIEIARISIFSPRTRVFQHVTLAFSDDLEWTWVDEVPQISASLEKAVGALPWATVDDEINLIIQEADLFENDEIADTVFGIEQFVFRGTQKFRTRDTRTSFLNQHRNIAGVVSLRHDENQLIGSYNKSLYIQEDHLDKLEKIQSVIQIDRVFHDFDYIE